jgi:predicted metal-dependent hydrolase
MRALHPTLSEADKAALLLQGVERFDRQEFFAAHEPWEEIWRSTTPEPRELFQGLVQVAAGLHHFVRQDRRAPALRLLRRGSVRLARCRPREQGLDLTALLLDLEAWERWLEAPAESAGPVPPWPLLAPHCKP